jgi:MtN3 and saliva related transmembrane protein
VSVVLASALVTRPTTADHLGYVAGVITVGAFLPQVVRAWRTRQTRDLSLGSFALLVTAGSLWVVYGALARDWPVVATNCGMVALNLALAVAKIRYDSPAE